jgi:hypothetical protein
VTVDSQMTVDRQMVLSSREAVGSQMMGLFCLF